MNKSGSNPTQENGREGGPCAPRAATIHVNDTLRALPREATVLALLRDIGLAERKGVAVAVNGGVVPRGAWLGSALADGDRVLVIQATQGG